MLQVTLYRHTAELSLSSVITKKIRLDDSKSLLIQIESSKSHIASLLEGSIVDMVAESGRPTDSYQYFSFLLDRLNRHLRTFSSDIRLEDTRVLLAIVEADTLHFSVLGEYFVYLIWTDRITDIARGMSFGNLEFSYISSGVIKPNDSLYLSNVDLLDYFTEEDLFDISHAEVSDEGQSAIERLIEREAGNKTIDCVILTNKAITDVSVPHHSAETWEKAWFFTKKHFTITVNKSKEFLSRLNEYEFVAKTRETITSSALWKNDRIRTALLGLGILVAGSLLYLAISGLFQSRLDSSIPEEYKNKLIEASLILEKAPKDLANKEAFKQNLKHAEELIFAVREKQVYGNDVKKLLETISILKKQMNGIESYDPKSHGAEYAFNDPSFSPVGVFDIGKKLYFVGKNKLAGPYIKGGELKTYNYPDGEEAISTDATEEGNIYILTKTNRVLKFYKWEFSYANVEGQKTWEEGRSIKTFNSNLYVLAANGSQIFKHKPSVNGFSAKNELLTGDRSKKTPILDFGVDGGFYILKKDLTVDKIFTTPAYAEKSVVLNGLPDGYALSSDKESPKFFSPPNANYLYVILENRIWILEPNSKNYKDVQSVRYIGQIEIVGDNVRALFVPKDGQLTVATDTGIYQVTFEISDGKIMIR